MDEILYHTIILSVINNNIIEGLDNQNLKHEVTNYL